MKGRLEAKAQSIRENRYEPQMRKKIALRLVTLALSLTGNY